MRTFDFKAWRARRFAQNKAFGLTTTGKVRVRPIRDDAWRHSLMLRCAQTYREKFLAQGLTSHGKVRKQLRLEDNWRRFKADTMKAAQ